MRVVFARHCETDWNLQKRLTGHTDIPLNDTGRKQAEILVWHLAEFKIKYIVSSDLSRARETAEIIGERFGIVPTYDKRLRECCFGSLEGKILEEAMKIHGVAAVMIGTPPKYDFRAFGGECRDGVLRRHVDLIGETISFCLDSDNKYSENFLFVGHGKSLNTLLAAMGCAPPLRRGDCRAVEYCL